MGNLDGFTAKARPAVATLRRFSIEVVVVLVAVFVYFGVRGLTGVDVTRAHDNAALLVDIEQAIGLYVEESVQDLFAVSHAAVLAMNWVYIYGHWPVIAAVLAWLLLSRRDGYTEVRGAMILSGAVGLLVFAVFPVAPPRFAEPGIIDTVTQHTNAYRVLQPPALTNQYAAMPSLHVGWDLLMGYALVTNARQLWLRAVGVVLPVAMLVSVVATGNHYVVDAIVGAALVVASLFVVRAVRARLARRRRERTADPPVLPRPRPGDAVDDDEWTPPQRTRRTAGVSESTARVGARTLRR
jgi:membrane-associated phospholipid phosphatase